MEAYLARMAQNLSEARGTKVGFLPDATYPDGTQVAQVAFWQEFGTKSIPPRPFFRPAIGQMKEELGPMLAAALKLTKYHSNRAWQIVGRMMAEKVTLEIISDDHRALSPITLMLRKMMDEDPSLRGDVSGYDIAEAARRVASGEPGATGTRAHPLVDTGTLLRAPTFEVLT